jgi:PEP-CTERM motif
MKRSSLTVIGSVLALTLMSGTQVRADFISWSYDWHRNPIAVSADPGGTGGISLTNEPLNHAVGNSDVVATNLRTFSDATPSHPDTFTNKMYSLILTLTDTASHKSGKLIFTGEFNGTLTANSADITNTWLSQATQTITLGKNIYTVSLNPFSPPGPPSATNAGGISTHVTVAADPSGGPPHAPEPSTLALSGLGLSFLGLASWRRWRKARI